MEVRSKKYFNYNLKFKESKIIYHSKFNRLRWSNFEIIIQPSTKVFISNTLQILTDSLSLYFIEEKHKKLLDLIYDLSENQNLTSKEISDYLNDNGYKTVRGNSEFYPKLVWMILKKYRKRLSRIGNYEAIYLF